MNDPAPPQVISRITLLRTLLRERRFDEALSIVESIAETDMTEDLWVLRGIAIQLSNGTELPLTEAKRSFECAIRLNAKHVEAVIELAWFQFNVEDDPKGAARGFSKALDLIAAIRNDALSGIVKCQSR